MNIIIEYRNLKSECTLFVSYLNEMGFSKATAVQFYADDVSFLSEDIYALLDASREVGLDVNAE